MGIINTITNVFRSNKNKVPTKVDNYGILEPLMSVKELAESAESFTRLVAYGISPDFSRFVKDALSGRKVNIDHYTQKGIEGYKLFVKALGPHEQTMEKNSFLSSVLAAAENVNENLNLIEDNFQSLFGSVLSGNEDAIRTSSLFVIGYIQTAETFADWISHLVTVFEGNGPVEKNITPYQLNQLADNAKQVGQFVSDNLNKWNPRYKGLLKDIEQMQKKGSDVAVKSGDNWMDAVVGDTQFSTSELNLMEASLKNPMLMVMTGNLKRYKDNILKNEATRDWLISKIAYNEAKKNGLMEDSPEYKRLTKVVNYYADLVSEYEQKLERMRA